MKRNQFNSILNSLKASLLVFEVQHEYIQMNTKKNSQGSHVQYVVVIKIEKLSLQYSRL